MATVSERIKDRFETAKGQLEDLEKKVGELPQQWTRKAKESFDEVPAQLRGAWDSVVVRLRSALDFASKEDLAQLAERVDDLAKKVEKLIRGDKIRAAAKDKTATKR